MRALVLPASLVLGFLLYLPLPKLADRLPGALRRLYGAVLRLFTDKRGRSDARMAFIAFLALLGGVSGLLSAVHPALAALFAAPLYVALAEIPCAATVKRDLDGGSHAGDLPAYEALVRERCARMAEAFVPGLCVPVLLVALGAPFGVGGALGWMALGVRAAGDEGRASRLLAALGRGVARVYTALLLLCSCLVGRNPFRTRGHGVAARALSILGLAEGEEGGHPPVAGDLAQAAFLCGFAACLLCAGLTLLTLPLAARFG